MEKLRDPVQIIESLSVEQIEARLDEIDREGQALRVLLRAARARGRVIRRKADPVLAIPPGK
jgi:hypothetical protein